LSTLVPLEREVRLLQEDGSGELIWFLVRLRPYRTTDDRIDGVVATFVDITSTKQTEQALRGARERYQLLVQSTTEYAMFTMDEAGIVDSWNRGAERIFGYSEPEILGQPGAIIFVPEDRAEGEAESELRRAREHGEASDERWHMRKDGSRFWASGVLTALRDGERLRGYAKVMRDNTARKEAEEALQQSRDELQALNETLEQRVETRTEMLQQRTEEVRNLATQLTMAEHEERSRIAQVLHDDLQQRLYAIQLQLAFLRSAHNEGDEEGFTDEYESLDEALEEVIRTTRQLNVDLSPAILRGEGLREAIMWLVGQMKEQHGLEVTLEAEHAFPVADEGLRVLLFQAVRELLFNVVKHAGVDVARVELEAVDHSVRVRVIDKGRGFAAAGLRDHAVQASGLATIQRRLNLVGGEMAVNSEVGTGTRVVLTAPLQLAAGAGAETSV
jgi:PAS domain S-box-containing protein